MDKFCFNVNKNKDLAVMAVNEFKNDIRIIRVIIK